MKLTSTDGKTFTITGLYQVEICINGVNYFIGLLDNVEQAKLVKQTLQLLTEKPFDMFVEECEYTGSIK